MTGPEAPPPAGSGGPGGPGGPGGGDGGGRRRSGVLEQTILICCLIGTAQMTWGVIVPVLPLFLGGLGIGVALLGPIIAAFAIGRVISNVPAGLLLRRLRPRPYLYVIMLGLAAVTAVTGLAPDPGWLIAARVVAGLLGGAAVTVGFAVLVTGAPAERRGSAMATATVVQMSAGAVGAVLGGAVVTVTNVPITFAVAAAPLLLVLLWDTLRPATHYWSAFDTHRAPATPDTATPDPATPADPAPAQPTDSATSTSSPGPAVAGRPGAGIVLAGLAVLSFATFFARFAGEQGLIPVLAYGGGGLTPLTLGIAMAVATLGSLAMLPLVGRFIDRGARLTVLLPAGVLGALALASFPFLQLPLVFAGALIVYSMASSAVAILPGVVTAERFGGKASGAVVGLTRTAGDVGAAVGPIVVFALADAVNAEVASATMGAALLVAVVFFAVVMTTRPRP